MKKKLLSLPLAALLAVAACTPAESAADQAAVKCVIGQFGQNIAAGGTYETALVQAATVCAVDVEQCVAILVDGGNQAKLAEAAAKVRLKAAQPPQK